MYPTGHYIHSVSIDYPDGITAHYNLGSSILRITPLVGGVTVYYTDGSFIEIYAPYLKFHFKPTKAKTNETKEPLTEGKRKTRKLK